MSQIQFESPFRVTLQLKAASIGERYVAAGIDLFLMVCFGLVLGWALNNICNDFEGWDHWSTMAVMLLVQLPVIFYSLLCELISKGYTPGKYIMKIRVVSADGEALTFGQCLIRWVLYWLDAWVMASILGLLSMLFSRNVQRLGDRAANTLVLSTRFAHAQPPRLQDETDVAYHVQLPLVVRLSDADMQRIRTAFEKAKSQSDFVLIKRLAAKIEEVTGQSNPFDSLQEYVETTIADYRYLTSK